MKFKNLPKPSPAFSHALNVALIDSAEERAFDSRLKWAAAQTDAEVDAETVRLFAKYGIQPPARLKGRMD